MSRRRSHPRSRSLSADPGSFRGQSDAVTSTCRRAHMSERVTQCLHIRQHASARRPARARPLSCLDWRERGEVYERVRGASVTEWRRLPLVPSDVANSPPLGVESSSRSSVGGLVCGFFVLLGASLSFVGELEDTLEKSETVDRCLPSTVRTSLERSASGCGHVYGRHAVQDGQRSRILRHTNRRQAQTEERVERVVKRDSHVA
ncbi:hypothetical protein BD309DRAFT_962499 [Dichomitus squalens]|nr:hypothetical protein BD309DRAFT_962499 [Dichomitus squalens]